MADYLSPFASVLVQQPAGTTPSEPSRCGSPVRVVGFDSSPTSVVSLRRSQSASESSAAAVLDGAAATAEGGAPPASVSTPAAADPPMGFGRAPRSLPLDPRAASMARQSSLRTLLLQQEQLTQLHKRLSINTGRTHAGAHPRQGSSRGHTRPDGAAARHAGAALVHRTSDDLEDLAGTLPSAALHPPCGKGLATLPERGCVAGPPAVTQQPRGRCGAGDKPQGVAVAARRSSAAGIDIPERLRRAGGERHLSDELIAAAAAAAAGSSAAHARAATAPGSGPRSSSGGSSHSGSPSDGPSPPKQPAAATATPPRVAVTREVLEAQAEAVAAAAQARVLQQALAQERQRADQLERQLQALMREFAEERAASQQQLTAALHAARAQQPAPAAARQQQQQRLLEEQHEQLLAAQWAAAAAAQPALPQHPQQMHPQQLHLGMPAVAVAERSGHGQWGEPPALDDLAAVLAAALDN